MTGIIIDSNSYIINTGSTNIEYASSGNCISYSMYGEEIPYNDIWKVLTGKELLALPNTPNSGEQSWKWIQNLLNSVGSTYKRDFNMAFCSRTWNLEKPIKITKITAGVQSHPYGCSSHIEFIGDGKTILDAYPKYVSSGSSGNGDYKETTFEGSVIINNTFSIYTKAEYTTAKGVIRALEMEIKA